MTQRDLFGARTEPPPEPVRALYDVDCTPSPVAHQGVLAATQGMLRPGDAPRVLDVCAGSGSWARAVRLLFPRACITALEVRADERPSLGRWADEVVIGDVAGIVTEAIQAVAHDESERTKSAFGVYDRDPRDLATLLKVLDMLSPPGCVLEPRAGPARLGTYDLIIGNPPFSLVDPRKPPKKGQPGKSRLRAFEVLVVALRMFLAPRGRLALYVPAAWWQRGGDVAALAREHQPFLQRNVPLPVSHRGAGQQAASDAYAIYVWAHPSVPSCGWHCCDLPILTAEDRRWREVPGTER